jgi:hypothetical protein
LSAFRVVKRPTDFGAAYRQLNSGWAAPQFKPFKKPAIGKSQEFFPTALINCWAFTAPVRKSLTTGNQKVNFLENTVA